MALIHTELDIINDFIEKQGLGDISLQNSLTISLTTEIADLALTSQNTDESLY